MEAGVSVVICTYNGAALLPETIWHLAQQRVRPEIAWEVIVVDNASTDDTAAVAVAEWEKHRGPVPFSLLHQPLQGLSYARELALEQAQYEFVLFCDDDNWLMPGYISRAYELMLQHPAIGVLGGNGELLFETAPPHWAASLSMYAHGPQAPASGKVKSNVVYGAGCVMRRAAYEIIVSAGFRTMLTDRKGASLSSGGDYELCYAIALAGFDIWYDDCLKFKHFMPAKRINWEYSTRFFKESAQSFEVLIPYRIRTNLGGRNILAFNLKYVRIILAYVAKLAAALLERQRLAPGTEAGKINTLKLLALKSKLLSFANYSGMRENFLKILKVEKQYLRHNL
ncbi:glycosyltransferase [Botryobacter ruber]|uniref:glycosyltransferase n=1 Tax=Botryobacter ruber TaxID=2171629 RepID=UPI000E0A5937|nr:glycosyltransferase [Botryobacter ruber]